MSLEDQEENRKGCGTLIAIIALFWVAVAIIIKIVRSV